MTLVQMAVLLVVVSLVMLPFFEFQKVVKKQEQKTQAFTSVEHVAKALKMFAQANGRYPLPANPELSITDSSAGVEVAITVDETLATNCFNIASNPRVHTTHKVTCRDGTRDSYTGSAPEGNNDRVLIGAVPFAALGLKPDESLDRFGNKFMYAVTYGLTRSETFADDKGSIRLINQTLINAADTSDAGTKYYSVIGTVLGTEALTTTSKSRVHFVVISHGENRLGARAANGKLTSCATGTTPTDCSSGDAKFHFERANFFPGASGQKHEAHFRLLVNDDNAATQTNEFNTEITKRFLLPGKVSLTADGKLSATPRTFDDSVAFATTIAVGNWTPLRFGGSSYNLYLGDKGGLSAVGVGAAPVITADKARLQIKGDVVADSIQTPLMCINNSSGNTKQKCWDISSANTTEALGLSGVLPMVELGRTVDSDVAKIKALRRGELTGENGSQAVKVDSTRMQQINPLPGDGLCPDGARGVNSDGSLICL